MSGLNTWKRIISIYLKKIIPSSLREKLIIYYFRYYKEADAEYRGLTTKEVFNKIYEEGAWGQDAGGVAISGDGTADSLIVDPYLEICKKIILKKNITSATDLGCGDFSVGHRIQPLVSQYNACDISSIIVERNSRRFISDGLTFYNIDIINDRLPNAEIAMCRQVLQHLSNDGISQFLENIKTSNFDYLLLTEHIPGDKNATFNLDKTSGAAVRLAFGSGIDITRAPFLFQYPSEIVLELRSPHAADRQAIIQTRLFRLNE